MTASMERLNPALNAYFNALLRETSAGTWHPGEGCFSITHPTTGETLLIPCQYHSHGGRHLFGVHLALDAGMGPHPIRFQEAVDWTLSLPELQKLSPTATRERFRRRVQHSEENLRLALAYRHTRLPDPGAAAQTFIESEQALVNGHSIHPCPKDRTNMSRDEATAFAPEYGAQFPLIWYSVDPQYLRCHDSRGTTLATAVRSLTQEESPTLRQAINEASAAGQVVIPCHPYQHRHWQAHPTLRQLQAQGSLRSLGMGTVPWGATSSLRAIWADQQPWMLKFSLSVRITNSVRHLQPQEAVRGPALADLLDSEPARQWLARHPDFHVLNEPIAAALCDSDGQPLPETTLVFRDNPFQGAAAHQCELLASLLQDDPATGLSRLGRCLQARKATAGDARAWLLGYLDLAVRPLLDAQSNLGLLFGAHQQNLVLRLDDRFQPTGAWFRDCQGTGFSALAHRSFGPGLQASENELPDTLAVRLFCYYLFVNSTFNVITSLAAAGLCPEADLWAELADWLRQRHAEAPADTSAIDYLQNSPQLYAKNNFLCSLRALNENTLDDLEAIYHPMPNPLASRQPHSSKDEQHHDKLTAH